MFYWGPDLDDGVVSWNESSAVRFGAVLRVLREARGLTQESLAFQAGVTKNQVQLIEAGRGSGSRDSGRPSNPRLSTIVGLSDVLGITVAELMARADL